MEKKDWLKIGAAIALIAVATIILVILLYPGEEKCIVWQKVDEKQVVYGEYDLFLNETSLMIPVSEETFNWIDAGQSYNFYCRKPIGLAWKCDVSYECGECKRCEYLTR